MSDTATQTLAALLLLGGGTKSKKKRKSKSLFGDDIADILKLISPYSKRGTYSSAEDMDFMSDFICEQLKANPNRNPITGRAINPCVHDGVYNRLVANCDMKALARGAGRQQSQFMQPMHQNQFVAGSVARTTPGKFWEIIREGNKITVREGDQGTVGNTSVLTYRSEEEARTVETESVKDRIKRGYKF